MVWRFHKFLACGVLRTNISFQGKKFLANAKFNQWDDPILYKNCAEQIVRRCVPEEEIKSIINHFHTRELGDHFGPTKTVAKVVQSGSYWPSLFKYAYAYVRACDACQEVAIFLEETRCLSATSLR